MTTQSNIDYRVNEATKYVGHKGRDCKQINKIGQKANQFRFASAEDLFQLEIIFKVPAVITYVELKVKQVDQVVVDMYSKGEKILSQNQFIDEGRLNVYTTLKIAFGEKSQRFEKAFVRFCNHGEAKSTHIHYILFKGYKEQTSAKKSNAPKNVSEKDTFEPPSKRKITQEQKKVFETRNKQKQIKKTKVQELESLARSDRHLIKNMSDQDVQLQRALQLSKREQQQKLGKSGKKNKDDQFQKIPEEVREVEEYQFFDYEIVQWQKVKKIYEHVTPEWIEAQKQAQRELNIQSRHSLSNKIKIKIFKNIEFCISNIVGGQKSKLIQKIKQLGGKTVDDPTNGCYVITNRMQGAKINFAKTLTSVKFVNPHYIQDCFKMQAKMDQKEYRP